MLKKLQKTTIVSQFDPIDFPALDNDDLVHQYMVLDKAITAGRQNSPDESSQALDSNELSFHHNIETIAIQSTLKVGESTRALRDSIDTLSIAEQSIAIEKVLEGFDGEVQASLTPQLTEIDGCRVDAITAEKDLAEFKKENNLRRTATYPDSSIWTFGILLVALCVESLFNGLFFAKGNDLGLVGGVSIAFIISFLNISFGFASGYLVLRNFNHLSVVRKYLGLIFFLFLIFLSFVFNILIAHYREALSIDPDNATTLAVESFRGGILAVSDVESWLLFLVGSIFYVIAAYKGYQFDDPYPGYGKISRLKNHTLGELDDFRQQLIEEVDDIHNECLVKVDSDFKTIKQKQQQLNSYISAFEHQISIYSSHIQNLYSNLNYIITVYREKNSGEREAPRPKYFDKIHDQEFVLEKVSEDYSDKREYLSKEIEKKSKVIEHKRTSLLKVKDSWHSKIEKASRL